MCTQREEVVVMLVLSAERIESKDQRSPKASPGRHCSMMSTTNEPFFLSFISPNILLCLQTKSLHVYTAFYELLSFRTERPSASKGLAGN